MTERTERSPLSREVIRHLKDVPRIVAVGDSRHGAIHGTSLEVVQYLILNGTIPGSQRAEFHYQPGDLSVFPTSRLDLSNISGLEPPTDYSDFRGRATAIAEGIGRSHRFLTLLGLPIANAEDLLRARNLISSPNEDEEGNPLSRSYFLQKGFSGLEVDDAYHKADELERCGFLLGISPTIQGANGLSLIKGDSGEGDVAVRTFGRGLPYRFISGIEPLGDTEREYLDGLYIGN